LCLGDERELALEQLEAVTKIRRQVWRIAPQSNVDPLRAIRASKNRRLLSAERNGFQITPLVLEQKEWWNALSSTRWKYGHAARFLLCARIRKRILAPSAMTIA